MWSPRWRGCPSPAPTPCAGPACWHGNGPSRWAGWAISRRGDSYQYLELHQGPHEASPTYWQDRIRQVCSESGSPKLVGKRSSTLPANGMLPRAKSSYEIDFSSVPTPSRAPPLAAPEAHRTGSLMGHYTRSERAGPTPRPGLRSQRPASCHGPQTPENGSRVNKRVKPAGNHLPDLLSTSKDSSRRPHSSYDLQVRSRLSCLYVRLSPPLYRLNSRLSPPLSCLHVNCAYPLFSNLLTHNI